MTSVDNFDISDKIVEFLTINHDKLFTIKQIHSEFYEKYEEFKKLDIKKDLINKLKLSFMTIEGEYTNIYRIVKDDKHYLIWSLKTKDEIIKNLNITKFSEISKQYDREIEQELDDFLVLSSQKDYVKLIKQYIEENNFSFMFETNYMDGINHPIHILIINKELQIIKRMGDLIQIDFSIKNKEGKYCTDLAKETNNCEILEYILENIFTRKLLNIQKLNEAIKENQKQNYEKIDLLNKKVEVLTNGLNDIENKKESWETFAALQFLLITIYLIYCLVKYIL